MKRRHLLASLAAILLSSIASAVDRVPMERMAAYHRSVIVTHETDVTSAFMTYFKSHPEQIKHDFLVKIVPCLDKDGTIPAPSNATDVHVEDFPGGVQAKFKLGEVEVTTDFAPMLVGRGVQYWKGAAIYSIFTNPPTPVLLRVGGGTSVSFLTGTPPAFVGPDTVSPKDAQMLDNNTIAFESGEDPFQIAVRATGVLDRSADTGQVTARFAGGSGALVMAYADTADKALELSKIDARAERKAVDEYYANLLKSRIETPDANLNAAFRAAIITLEYSWIEPYGWIETIHHWLALWHMQHTAGAEWLGQEDRSRLCTLTHGRMLLPNGAVPQLWPNGQTHRDFGGSNQFWAWQIRHYLDFTGDKEFAKEVAPILDKVLNQTFTEYDPDGDMLLSWSQQIGNQEDMIGTPYDGTTPSVEGINMMRTKARLLDDVSQIPNANLDEILPWHRRIGLADTRLRDQLWMPDLGRYLFFRDALGYPRLDGQYHTLIYPSSYQPMERYSSLRHLLDRLTGGNGEIYCSNNFPNHLNGTWGMQAGAAQQPWAAWGLSGGGMCNEAWKPLKAVADWVMDANHRGSWPEVAQEPTPAYFSPPAGLFIASVIESLFGLDVYDKRIRSLTPCFPDSWDKAAVYLPNYGVEFHREGNRLLYRLESKENCRPGITCHIPLSRSEKITNNGDPVPKILRYPGVSSVTIRGDSPIEPYWSTNVTQIEVEYDPVNLKMDYRKTQAEGQRFDVSLSGDAIVTGVEDPCHVLKSFRMEDHRVRAELADDLLKPYLEFGRLGLMNFARRTFFLKCSVQEPPADRRYAAWNAAVDFFSGKTKEEPESVILPVDITVLPRLEAAFDDDVSLDGQNVTASMLLRANLPYSPKSPPLGVDVLLGDLQLSFNAQSNESKEAVIQFAVPADRVAQMSPGENTSTLLMNAFGKAQDVEVRLNARSIFESGPLAAHAASRMTEIELPEDKMMPDTDWRKLRDFPGFPHVPWSNSPPALEKLEGHTELAPPELPQVKFALPQRKFVPVSWKMGQPCFTLDLDGQMVKKLYVLVIPYLDNHDMFAEVARMTIRGNKGAVLYTRTLRTPGDLDWWPSAEVFGDDWSTARHGRKDRHGLLPMLKEGETDWPMAHPPAFPQPEYWATCLPVITGSCTMNVVELDLRTLKPVESLVIETLGVTPALGVVAVTAEGPGDDSLLDGTPWEVPAERRQPRTVFTLTRPEALEGWELGGDAFSICAVPSLFSAPTLNSLGKAHEQATGTALSPTFEIRPADKMVVLELHGGRSMSTPEGESLCAEVIEADTGKVLGRALPPASHLVQSAPIAVQVDKPTRVRLRLTDRNTDTTFAWIGVAGVRVGANLPEPSPLWN